MNEQKNQGVMAAELTLGGKGQAGKQTGEINYSVAVPVACGWGVKEGRGEHIVFQTRPHSQDPCAPALFLPASLPGSGPPSRELQVVSDASAADPKEPWMFTAWFVEPNSDTNLIL